MQKLFIETLNSNLKSSYHGDKTFIKLKYKTTNYIFFNDFRKKSFYLDNYIEQQQNFWFTKVLNIESFSLHVLIYIHTSHKITSNILIKQKIQCQLFRFVRKFCFVERPTNYLHPILIKVQHCAICDGGQTPNKWLMHFWDKG